MDVCGLLRKMKQLHLAVSSMKQTLHVQTEVSEELHDVTADLRSRVSALEQRADQGCGSRSVPVKEQGVADIVLNAALDMEHSPQALEGDSLPTLKGDTPVLCT
uniref:PPUP8858 n=1 Tax=Poeciliopsis prolifica TaxID=188132 RepID=A0A0S7ENY2_9TELE